VSAGARLVNTIVTTPIPVIFLIVLVGTTLEVLTERTRNSRHIARWRSKMETQTIILGYGIKGRSVARSLVQSGAARQSVVVVDLSPEAVATIVAPAREEDNQDVLGQRGADEVGVSSGAPGPLLAICPLPLETAA
jgi:FlaA1/EpsC-like NDP-sugar epimerase